MKNLTVFLVLPAVCGLSLVTALRMDAGTYDLGADWSEAANPSGPWALREGVTLLSQVNAWPSGDFTTPQPAWARGASGNTILPAWFKSSATVGIAHDWQDGDIVIHTTDEANGAGSGPGNVTWTSPFNGFIQVSGAVWMGRDIGRGNHWTLSKNGTVLTGGDIFSGDAYSRASPFAFASGSGGASVLTNIPVAVDDVIRLQLEKTSLYGDYVGVHFIVAAEVAPRLSVALTSTNTVIVSWASSWTDWLLQQNTNDVRSVNWSDVTSGIQDDGTTKSLLVNPPAGSRFYRLLKP